MCLRVIIADKRPEFFSIWSEVFIDIKEIRILNIDVQTLSTLPELDAEIMRGIFAHEHYGGGRKIGESQILSTKGDRRMPSWVVTTPPFAAHLEKRQRSDGSFRYEIVQNDKFSTEQETYIVFSKIFDRVEQFNKKNPISKIKTIGFEAHFLNIPLANLLQEAKAIRKAYLDYHERHY